jgi:hypothetical protein
MNGDGGREIDADRQRENQQKEMSGCDRFLGLSPVAGDPINSHRRTGRTRREEKLADIVLRRSSRGS